MKIKKKDWTVLVYSNGNNELEPEMYKSKSKLEEIGSSDRINIIMEIGRESIELVNIIRPQEKLISENEAWAGVRRYYLLNREAVLIEDLGKLNMSSYRTLNEFLEWGISEYPANRYMVIISGHGFLVAALSDLSGEKPYTMGIYEMCYAINTIKKNLGVYIDILVLDICNMNNIELIYELGKDVDNTVKYLLTYVESGPLSGIPYDDLIKSIIENDAKTDTKELLKNIVSKINLELIALNVDHSKLAKVKYLINKLGYLHLSMKEDKIMNPKINYNEEYTKYLGDIFKTISKIIIVYSSYNENPPIKFITEDMYNINNLELFLKFYNSLSFTKNNYWANVVAKKSLKEPLNLQKSALCDYILTRDNIYSFVNAFNENLSEESKKLIIKNLYQYKGWYWN